MRIAKCIALAGIALSCSVALYAVTYVVPTDEVLVGKARAVVLARALTSYVEETEKHGIETVTVLSVEDVLKGDLRAGAEVNVRTIGGMVKRRAKIIPGAPRFVDGERVLVFLNPNGDDWVVTDFALGLFSFATDDTGREVVMRASPEIVGWDTYGKPYREPRRDAQKFLAFVRGAARNLPMNANYTVEERPLIGQAQFPPGAKLQIVPLTTYTASQYTMVGSLAPETDFGFRWKTFPTAVNWNRGNNATGGVPNNGVDAINIAFGAWNGEANSNINYVAATSTSDVDGIEQAADGVNNIVFEKALSCCAAFVCSGGVLGYGGVQGAPYDPTNIVGTETFYRITEGDVSMNQGVGACVGSSVTLSVYNSSVTHELGHTLGFRHSDKSRDNNTACGGSYECSSAAIMTAMIGASWNGALQAWDQHAAAALYPGTVSVPVPTSVTATATGAFAVCTYLGCSRTVTVSWTGVGGSYTYEIYANDGSGWPASPNATAAAATSSTTLGLDPNKAYLVCVKATDGANRSACSANDYTYPSMPPIGGVTTSNTPIYASQMNALRTGVGKLMGLSGHTATWSETITTGSTTIKKQHIDEIRSQLNTALGYLGFPAKTFAETITQYSTPVRASHISEIQLDLQ